MSHKKNKMVDSGSEIFAACEELKKKFVHISLLNTSIIHGMRKTEKKVRSHLIT